MASSLLIILVLGNFVHGEESETKEKESFDYIAWVYGIIGTITGTVGGYFLKRYFVNKDFKFQKQIEHEKWLLQRFNTFADDYYVPLAKFSFDARNNINRAAISRDSLSIKVAYYHISLFLTKYLEFKNTLGANFLLKPQEAENEAILSVRAILSSLPFDDLDLINIEKDMKSKMGFSEQQFRRNTFKSFKKWIESEYCNKSRSLILNKLNQLQKILDATSEKINHPEAVGKDIIKIDRVKNEYSPFYILFSNTKHVKKNESLVIFGGFDLTNIEKYSFNIGTSILTVEAINNNSVKLKIPDNIQNGVYDIFGTFTINQWSDNIDDETIGIAINIE